MNMRIAILSLLVSPMAMAADLPPPPAPPQQNVTETIAKQIGWLVIENANLHAQIEELQKQLKECRPGEPNK
jgi:hypothetical protein